MSTPPGPNPTTRRALKETFGSIGLFLFCVTLLPQIYKNWRRKSTEGVSESFILALFTSTVCYAVYVIVQRLAIPVLLDPECYIAASLVIWTQFFYYKRNWSVIACIGQLLVSVAICAGLQAGLIFLLQLSRDHGYVFPIYLTGILQPVIDIFSFIPQYRDLLRRGQDPDGLSMGTMWLMIVASMAYIVSLEMHNNMDWVACVGYLVLIVGFAGLIAVCWFLRRKKRKEEERLRKRDSEATVIAMDEEMEHVFGKEHLIVSSPVLSFETIKQGRLSLEHAQIRPDTRMTMDSLAILEVEVIDDDDVVDSIVVQVVPDDKV